MKKNRVYSNQKLRTILLVTLLCTAGSSCWAAGVLQPVDPSAQKLQFNEMAQRKQMVIDDEKLAQQSLPAGERKFQVQKIQLQIEGQVTEEELRPLLKPYENRAVSFDELQKAASTVNTYLRKKKNYYLATAFYPEQEIKDGLVTLKVVTGTYGNIHIYNKTKLSAHRAVSFSKPLKQGKEIKTRTVESVLENYNNLPGIDARAVMKPGM